MISKKYEKEAAAFAYALRKFAESPEAVENIESYLSFHFSEWIEKYANTPEKMAAEMRAFSEMFNNS